MIKGHGDDLHLYPNIRHNFSSNVYGDAEHSALIAHIQQAAPHVLGSYPEPEPYQLQAEIAESLGLSPKEVLVTNGATEAIYLIAHAFSPRITSFVEPTFSEYKDACRLMGHRIVDFAPEQLAQIQMLWLCNPNNPTGHICTEEAQWIAQHPSTLFVIDRSYEYFSRCKLPEQSRAENAIYIHSLTKRYRIPGLRLGYITANEQTIERIRAVRQPWSVNALAIEAGRWIVAQGFPETIARQELWAECDRLRSAIEAMGWEVAPSQTHFLLIRTPFVAHDLKQWLAHERGLLIRDASNFPTLSPYHIRIATQSPEANDELIRGLHDYITLHHD